MCAVAKKLCVQLVLALF